MVFRLALLLILLTNQLYAQVLPKHKLSIRVFDKKSQLISYKDSKYDLSYKIWDPWTKEPKFESLKAENGSEKATLEVDVDYGETVSLRIKVKNEEMIVHTKGELDSILFQVGEFKINQYENYLFSIETGENTTITNFKFENFKNSQFKSPTFKLDESRYNMDDKVGGCHSKAQALEEKHGGKNWADNTCVDEFQEMVISNDIETQKWIDEQMKSTSKELRTYIFPMGKTKFIKHEFFLKDSYDHLISVTEDNGKTWKKIMFLKNEWYVNIIYFTNEDKIGIDISNSGVVLISDFELKNWKYYVYDTEDQEDSEEPMRESTIGLIVQNSNWYENYFGNFKFSE